MSNNHGNQGAFHEICNDRVFPMFYHQHYSKNVKKTHRTRVVGLYYCVSCDLPTFAVKYRFLRPEERKQKTLEGIV